MGRLFALGSLAILFFFPASVVRGHDRSEPWVRHLPGSELFRKRPAGDVDEPSAVRGRVLNDARFLTPVLKARRRRRRVGSLRRHVHEHHDAIGVGKVHGPKHDGIHHREDCGVRADAERERRDRREREGGTFRKRAQRVTEILQESFDGAPPSCLDCGGSTLGWIRTVTHGRAEARPSLRDARTFKDGRTTKRSRLSEREPSCRERSWRSIGKAVL